MKTLLIILFLTLFTCTKSARLNYTIADCGNTVESPYLADDLMFTPEDHLQIAIRFIQLKKVLQEKDVDIHFLKESIDLLNKDYFYTNISFILIDSLTTIVMGKDLQMSDYKTHILTYKREHSTDLPAIDVFIYPVDFNYYPAVALAIKSDGIAIQKIFVNSNTLTHEIGHCLGLYHTHQMSNNTSDNNGYDAGDFICDTPATGNISNLIDANCSSINKRNNPNSLSDEEMKIIIHNYMTYVNKSCRREFTKDQIDRMRFNISKEPMLRETLIF